MFKKQAFTLAEVLITLAVIGIVAALTIGVFLPKIHSKIRERQIATAEVKFTKAMEQMALNNAIGPYYETTQEFVNELQNYLKISKVCDNEHFEDCFGYDKMHLAGGEEFEFAQITKGENIGKNEDYLETVGLVTIDGTGMIVSWNKKCDILEPKVYKWGNNTNDTTSCVAMLIDVNLDKSPNRINKDIAMFRAESPSCGMEFAVGGTKYCFGTPFAPTPLTSAQCGEVSGISGCGLDNDYWAGAYKQCKDEGKRLPTSGELTALAKYLYGTDNISYKGDTTYAENASGVVMNTTLLSNMSEALSSNYVSNNNTFAFWAGVEQSQSNAWIRSFFSPYTFYFNHGKNDSSPLGVCVK